MQCSFIIVGYVDIISKSYLATEVAPTKALHAMRTMNPCRGEFIRLRINGIRGYFYFSYLATEVAPTNIPYTPRKL
jgi:hypothetical protein